jgi:hypothetical protein
MIMPWDRKSARKADILAKAVVFHSMRKTTVISYSQGGGVGWLWGCGYQTSCPHHKPV